jgi:hypothetical protein
VIRREHEFTHYFIYRLCGMLRTSVVDELLADFVGLIRAFGTYRPELARRFLGIETFPHYRPGGRLEYYQRHAPLSPDAFRVLMMLAWMVTGNLGLVARNWPGPLKTNRTMASVIYALATQPLETLASEDLPALLEAYIDLESPFTRRA